MKRSKAIFFLAAPVAGGLIVQNGMSLISLAVVGRLGDAAVAGMGVAGALASVWLSLLFGLDAGVQALAAQRLGAGDAAGAGRILGQGLILSGVAGLLLTVNALLAGPPLMGLLIHDPVAAKAGTAFLMGFAPILLALAGNMTFSAYWNGAGAPAWPFVICLIQTPVHLALSLVLALGVAGLPALGPFGAGLAAFFALALHIALAVRLRRIPGLSLARVDFAEIRRLLAIGAPVSAQGAMQGVGMTVYFGVIARIGVSALAAVNVMSSLMQIYAFAAVGFGAATATLVGGALGRGEIGEARQVGWEAAWLATVVTAVLAAPLAVAPGAALALFVHGGAASVGATALQVVALSVGLNSLSMALSYALRGAGATAAPSAASFALLWLVQIPLSWLVGVQMGWGLTGVAWMLLARAALEAGAMAVIWKRWRAGPALQTAAAAA